MRRNSFASGMAAVAVMTFAMAAATHDALAATKTVMFGWEDGTSTATYNVGGNNLNPLAVSPDSSSVTLANVSTGAYRDYGPSGNPFITPVDGTVAPKSGTRMLEATVTPMTIDSGTDAVVYMGVITGLNPGDTY